MFSRNVTLVVLLIMGWLGFESGKRIGFIDGIESANFGRIHANQKLQQCLRIVRAE
jgi:hypothetical protein